MERKDNVELAKQYIKDNIWRRFWKQKAYEVLGIPVVIGMLIFLPLSIGKIFTFIVGEKNIIIFVNWIAEAENVSVSYLTNETYWLIGFFFIVVFVFIVVLNYYLALHHLEEKAISKYNVKYYELT